jgi:DNA-binding GntR family transcriptional regulator
MELERLIADGTLAPGERLNEVAIGRRLGVSRGPVREAARALEKTGLVTVIMNRGAFVRSLSLDEAMAIYELNAVLFGLAAGLLAAGVTAAEALVLRDLVDGMDRAVAAGDRDGFFARNVEFHTRIMTFSPNREAETVYLAYAKKLMLLRRRSFEREGHMAQANREHRALLEAILAGNSALARERAEAHARAGRARFLSAIERPDASEQGRRRDRTRINSLGGNKA